MTVSSRLDNMRVIRAPRGPERTAKSWLTEAPLRMLMNNLDPEVAERPDELVVYGGIGRAARDWRSFDRIVATLRRLEADETLLVQSGKPVGVFRTHPDAPRVLIANSNLVPHWATWDHFNELDRKGLMMYGQMTAGSWIYIGSQGIVQGTYETFAELGRQHYGGDLAGQVDPDRRTGRHGRRAAARGHDGRRLDSRRRVPAEPASRCASETGYLDVAAKDLDEALAIIDDARRRAKPSRSGSSATPPKSVPELVRRGVRPDAVTDQTSCARSAERLSAAAAGRSPSGRSGARAIPRRSSGRRAARWPCTCAAMLEFHRMGVPDRSTTATIIRQMAQEEGVADAFDFPGFVPAYHPAALLPG